jgi:hypothetical protein
MMKLLWRSTGRAWWMAASMALAMSTAAAAQQTATNPVVLSGRYSDLHPQQKRLVDDWFRRLSEVLKQQVSPEEGYDNLPVSDKTTFSAVTHALLRTKLTDETGAILGESAMTLVDKIDRVLGKVEGAGGDKQFRIYVQLKPNAIEILEKSQEFSRASDNTVYHKGFPICFRSPGTPSIQVSMTRDGMRADIDVDYRSSKFPVALVNGHLSSSNSDIRAGNNDERHNNRWAGVSKAFQYLSPRAYPCANLYRSEEIPEPASPAEAGQLIQQGLERVANFAGSVRRLEDAITSPQPSHPDLKLVPHADSTAFAIVAIPDSMAQQADCSKMKPGENSIAATPNSTSKNYGQYYATGLQLTKAVEEPSVLWIIWGRESDQWKIIAYHVLTP